MTPLRNMLDHDVTSELLALVDQAGEFERTAMLVNITGESALRLDKSRAGLLDLIERMPARERRAQLHYARRVITEGQRVYGAFEPHTDRRDMAVEATAELADASFYLTVHAQKTGNARLLRLTQTLYRELLTDALNREAV